MIALSPPTVPPASDPKSLVATISSAEKELLPHVREGLSNKEIAVALGKSPATVKAQLAAILHKLNLPNRGRLIAWLYRHNLGTAPKP